MAAIAVNGSQVNIMTSHAMDGNEATTETSNNPSGTELIPMAGAALIGNRFCNTALRVTDLDRSMDFYGGVLGLKELYRIDTNYAILLFLGYPHSATEDTPLTRREAGLELVVSKGPHANGDDKNLPPSSHLVKLAFHVSDMPVFMEHVKRLGLKVVKEAGAAHAPEELALFLGCPAAELPIDTATWEMLKAVCFVHDPDGYLVEIIPY